MGGKVENIIWGVAGAMILVWLVAWHKGAGIWVHALLFTGVLLILFDLVVQKRDAAPQRRPRRLP
ncbi:MAG: hypothetical protein IT204_09675 [Fimbriimonadaceae bacterium]|nr:hypothetical protein [Fimbriimonadaceae bacterium]